MCCLQQLRSDSHTGRHHLSEQHEGHAAILRPKTVGVVSSQEAICRCQDTVCHFEDLRDQRWPSLLLPWEWRGRGVVCRRVEGHLGVTVSSYRPGSGSQAQLEMPQLQWQFSIACFPQNSLGVWCSTRGRPGGNSALVGALTVTMSMGCHRGARLTVQLATAVCVRGSCARPTVPADCHCLGGPDANPPLGRSAAAKDSVGTP